MDKYCAIDLGAYQTRVYFEDSSETQNKAFQSWILKDEQGRPLIGDSVAEDAKKHKMYHHVQSNFLKDMAANNHQERALVQSMFKELTVLFPELKQLNNIALVVPSYFNEVDTRTIKEIAKKENITIAEHTVSQGMAKATFLATDRRLPQGSRFAIYDWSASQFEFSVFEVLEEQQVKQLGKVSSIEISGYQVDEALWNSIAKKYKELRGRDLDLETFHYLDSQIQDLKDGLSQRDPFGLMITSGARNINVDISISELLDAIRPMLEQSYKFADEMLQKYPVQQLYLTGGVTQILSLQQSIQEHFQLESVKEAYKADMAVKGAVLYSKQLETQQREAQENLAKQQEQAQQQQAEADKHKAEAALLAAQLADSQRQAEATSRAAEETQRQAALIAAQQAEEQKRKLEEEHRRELEALQNQQTNNQPKKSSTTKIVIFSVIGTFVGLGILGVLTSKTPSTAQTAEVEHHSTEPVQAVDTAEAPAAEAIPEEPNAIEGENTSTASDEQVNQPNLQTGMHWNIKTIDLRRPQDSYDNVEFKLNDADENHYYLSKTIIGRSNNKTELVYDRSMNLISGATGSYSPALTYYDFPLYVGKTWDITSNVSGNNFKNTQSSKGEVEGWETISSPYWNDIKALKVVVVFDSYKDGELVSHGLDVSWYYPEIGRAIKSEEYSWNEKTQEWDKGREHYVFNFKQS